jgi:hypothetical protein
MKNKNIGNIYGTEKQKTIGTHHKRKNKKNKQSGPMKPTALRGLILS